MALQFFGNAYKTFIQLINSVLVLMYVHLCHQFLQFHTVVTLSIVLKSTVVHYSYTSVFLKIYIM